MYKKASSETVPLNDINFIEARAKFFRKLDELHANSVVMFYHDETWINVGDDGSDD